MNTFNSFVTLIFDWLLILFSGLSPTWGLVFVSVLSGIILVWLYGLVSNQQGIRKVKRKISSQILEAVLYRHDVRVCLRAQGRMFLYAFVYLGYALPPLVVLMVPCVIILAQLNLRYSYRPLSPSDQAIVKLEVDDPSLLMRISLEPSEGMTATPSLRIPFASEVFWRVTPKKSDDHYVTVNIDGAEGSHQKTIHAAQREPRISAVQYKSWWKMLLYPGDKALGPESALSMISVTYPEVRYRILGMPMHWLVVFLIFSLLSGIIASKPLGVAI